MSNLKTEFKDSKLFIKIGIAFIAVIFLWVIGSNLFETNKAGYYHVRQKAYFGDLRVRYAAGTYGQMFDDVTEYKLSREITINSIEDTAQTRIQFPNGYAAIEFSARYELPYPMAPKYQSLDGTLAERFTMEEATEKTLLLHNYYGDEEAVKRMIEQQVIEAIINTGTLMDAEEAYSHKRADFTMLAREQALKGLYAAQFTTDTIYNSAGQRQEIKRYSVKRDGNGKPVIVKESLLQKYGITLPQFNIKQMNFDSKLIGLIESRKDAQKAQQDAMTEKAQGETRIAKEKADQEVLKIREVTVAEKQKQVAELDAEKAYNVAVYAAKEAEENKKALIFAGQGEAEANRLKVSAGLTPQERAQFDKDTRIGVAEAVAKVKLPALMILGDSKGNGNINPFDAVGLKAFNDLIKDMSTDK